MQPKRVLVVLAACLLAGLFTWALGDVLAQGSKLPDSTEEDPFQSSEISILRAQAATAGSVPVIVGLQIEGFDTSIMAVEEQYEARMVSKIAAVQGIVLSDLENTSLTNAKRYDYIPYMALSVDEAGLEVLLKNPYVTSVTADQLLDPLLDTSVPLIKADLAHWSDYRGQNQTIAILDSGVDRLHPDLSGKVVSEACYSTNNGTFLASSLCPNGQESQTGTGAASVSANNIAGRDHGTTVAGIAAAVAPGANLISINVMSRLDDITGSPIASLRPCATSGRRSPCVRNFTSDLLSGMQRVYALRNSFNIAAVNVSIGGTLYGGTCDSINPALTSMIAILRGANIATVIATGNDAQRAQITFPACISNAISVGSTIARPEGSVDRVANLSNINNLTTLLAPGEPILAPVPVSGAFSGVSCRNGSYTSDGHCTDGGTSLAAPHVAGAVAVMRSADGSISVPNIKNILANNGPLISDQRSGGFISKRRLDVYAALCAATTCDPDDYRILGINQTRTGSLSTSPKFDFDYYFFDGVAGQPVTIRMDRTGGNIDPIINLRDSAGIYLAYNNNGGGGVNALINRYYLPRTGRYIIMVNTATGNTSGTYSLRLTQDASNQNPVPILNRLTRNSATLGSPQGFYVGIEGENFIPSSVVRWDGYNKYTVFNNDRFLWFYVYPTDLRVSGPHSISVYNGLPGGGVSNAQPFFVNFPRLGTSALLAPEANSIPVELATTFGISWTHPTDSWRVMQNIDFWFEDNESVPLFKLRFSEGNPTSTLSLLDTEGVAIASGALRSGEFGEDEDLVLSDILTLHMGQTQFFGSGRDVVISPTISFDEHAVGSYTMAFSIDDDNYEIQDADVFGPMNLLPSGCDKAIDQVTINGPETGMIGTSLNYQASIDPLYPTGPITYLWSPEPDYGQGTAQVSYSWNTAGVMPVNVTVSNCAGFAGDQTDVKVYSSSSPALAVSKQGPPTAVAGDLITYVLSLTNTGAFSATTISLIDQIPTGAAYMSGGSHVGDSVIWAIPELGGYGAVITETFSVTAQETIVNSDYYAEAQGGYHASGNEAVETAIVDAQTIITETQPATIAAQGNMGMTTIMLPPGAVFAPTIVAYTKTSSPAHPAPESWVFGGEAFDLKAYQEGHPVLGFQFGDTLEITFNIPQAQQPQEDHPMLFYWNGSRWSNQGITCAANPTLTCQLATPPDGSYALWFAGSGELYLPFVGRP